MRKQHKLNQAYATSSVSIIEFGPEREQRALKLNVA